MIGDYGRRQDNLRLFRCPAQPDDISARSGYPSTQQQYALVLAKTVERRPPSRLSHTTPFCRFSLRRLSTPDRKLRRVIWRDCCVSQALKVRASAALKNPSPLYQTLRSSCPSRHLQVNLHLSLHDHLHPQTQTADMVGPRDLASALRQHSLHAP